MKKALSWVRANLLSPPILFLVVVVALALLGFGFKVYLGDVIRKIRGLPSPQDLKKSEPIPEVDPGRISPDGKLIPPGEVDTKGWVQPVVYPIPEPDIFSSPSTVTVPTPEGPLTVELPIGVEREEVKEVVVIKPNVIAVTVTNKDAVGKETVDSLLEKYKDL